MYVTVDGLNYETEGYAKDDVVIYTKANGDIQSMQLAEVIEAPNIRPGSIGTCTGSIF